MPRMFAEPDLAAFQRLRCAFDPDGLANPGKVMPTPRLCGEVPGPYRQHPLERPASRSASRHGHGRANRARRPRPPQEAAEVLRDAGASRRGVRLARRRNEAGMGRPGAAPTSSCATAALDAIVEHNAGDLTAVLEAGVPLARAQARVRGGRPDAGARSAATRAARPIGGVVATADSGPLRHRYGAARDLVLGVTVALSDGTRRPGRRPGDQERRRLRPGQAASPARSGRWG